MKPTRLAYGLPPPCPPPRGRDLRLIGSGRPPPVATFSKEQGVVGQDVIPQIDAIISGRRMLAHPFYQRWLAGDLTLDDLRSYAGQYYKFEAAFPGYLPKG